MMKRFLKAEFVFPCLIFIFLSYILLIDPIIGRQNNGDFGRTMFISGLTNISDRYADIYDGFIHSKYLINPFLYLIPWGPDWTCGVIIIKISIVLNLISHSFKYFDIRFLAFLYIIIFSFSVYLILKHVHLSGSKVFKWLSGGIMALLFTDIGYVSYFNSFFGEAASYVFLFLFIGSAMFLVEKEEPTKWNIMFFMITSILFLTAKSQNTPLIVFVILFYLRLLFMYKETILRRTIVWFTIVSILITGLAFVSIGHVTTICNKYQTVFTGILKDSPTPRKDLQYLGLDKSFAQLAGTNFFTQGLPIDPMDKSLEKDLYSKISSIKVLNFYITHPQRLYSKLMVVSQNAFVFYRINEGNYQKGEYGNSNKIYNTFNTWLSNKYQHIFQNLYLVIGFTVLYFLILLFYHFNEKSIRKKAYIEIFILIGLFGASQYILPIIGSGEADLAKHLFFLNLCYDMMFAASFVWIIETWGRFFCFTLRIPRNFKSIYIRYSKRFLFCKNDDMKLEM
jgi:hypothetical protein